MNRLADDVAVLDSDSQYYFPGLQVILRVFAELSVFARNRSLEGCSRRDATTRKDAVEP